MKSPPDDSKLPPGIGPSDGPAFAPADPWDGRDMGQWKSRYEGEAKKEIRFEAWYLVTLFFVVPLAVFVLWLGLPNLFLQLPAPKYEVLCRFLIIALAGLHGGTLFGMKWLYHVVAKGSWNLDRRLWRLLSPLISAGLAFAIGVLIASTLFGVLDAKAIRTTSGAYAVGFLVGYFSDSAVAKLAEIAKSLFGQSERHLNR